MRLNRNQRRRRGLLSLGACLTAALGGIATAQADCTAAAGCNGTAVGTWRQPVMEPEPWFGFSVEAQATPVSYPAGTAAGNGAGHAELRFELPPPQALARPVSGRPPMQVSRAGEPGLAVLFGSLARLMSDGSMALGRGALRSHARKMTRSQHERLLPPGFFGPRVEQFEVDLGLSYAADAHFATSIGYADHLGEDGDEPAFVSWFEFRF